MTSPLKNAEEVTLLYLYIFTQESGKNGFYPRNFRE